MEKTARRGRGFGRSALALTSRGGSLTRQSLMSSLTRGATADPQIPVSGAVGRWEKGSYRFLFLGGVG